MSARIVVTLNLEYTGEDTAEYGAAMEMAREVVTDAGDIAAEQSEAVRVVDVQVSG
jgi:hypothetical protein